MNYVPSVRLCLSVATASLSISTSAVFLNPAFSNPSAKPPAPANNSITLTWFFLAVEFLVLNEAAQTSLVAYTYPRLGDNSFIF